MPIFFIQTPKHIVNATISYDLVIIAQFTSHRIRTDTRNINPTSAIQF